MTLYALSLSFTQIQHSKGMNSREDKGTFLRLITFHSPKDKLRVLNKGVTVPEDKSTGGQELLVDIFKRQVPDQHSKLGVDKYWVICSGTA